MEFNNKPTLKDPSPAIACLEELLQVNIVASSSFHIHICEQTEPGNASSEMTLLVHDLWFEAHFAVLQRTAVMPSLPGSGNVR